MTQYDAELVTEDYDPTHPEARAISSCQICKVQYYIDLGMAKGSARKYCGTDCKTLAAQIRKHMRNGYPGRTLEDYLVDPAKFPRTIRDPAPAIPPPRTGGRAGTYEVGKTTREATKATTATAKSITARANAERAESERKLAALKIEENEAAKEDRAAIRDTLDASSIIPLHAQ